MRALQTWYSINNDLCTSKAYLDNNKYHVFKRQRPQSF